VDRVAAGPHMGAGHSDVSELAPIRKVDQTFVRKEGQVMISIFDRNSDLVAWLNNSASHLFDTDMNWLAYVSGGQLWSSENGNWLGPLKGTTLLDHSGRPVGWHPRNVTAWPPVLDVPALYARLAQPAPPDPRGLLARLDRQDQRLAGRR
jgi:hypothetical protein